MQVILLERVPKLGQMGETVRVRDGYARNYLLPQNKALRATKQNQAKFDSMKVELEARNLERRKEAEAVAVQLADRIFVAIRQAGETGQLYGSVSTRDIAELLAGHGFRLTRQQVDLNQPIKALGMHTVEIVLHPEVIVPVTINVARTEDEARRQALGEDVLAREEFAFEEEEEEELAAEPGEGSEPAPDGAEAPGFLR